MVDGSFLPDIGITTTAWVLAGRTGLIEATGYLRLPDGDNMNDAYRADLFGLNLTMLVLSVLQLFKPDLSGFITISYDNDEALRHGIEYKLWPRATAPHFDLIATIHRYRRLSPITLHPKRARRHQDNKKGSTLTRLEELNVIADHAAKTIAYKIEQNRTNQWNVCVNNIVIKKDIRPQIEHHIVGQGLMEHWISKGKFTANEINVVDWDALQGAVTRKPLQHQRWATQPIRWTNIRSLSVHDVICSMKRHHTFSSARIYTRSNIALSLLRPLQNGLIIHRSGGAFRKP